MAEEKKETKDLKDTKEVKDDKGMPEWLAPILSALGSMGGSYMLWIKPLQERMDILVNQMSELRTEVKELKQQNKEYEQELENVNSQLENNLNGGGYLPTKKSIGQGSHLKKRI
jgi:hypothetical protein